MALGEWVQLIYCAPSTTPVVVGVLLLDPRTNQLHARCQQAWEAQCEQDDLDVVHAFVADLEQQGVPGDSWLNWIEQTASHTLQISERQHVAIESLSATLDCLYAQSFENTHSIRTSKVFDFWEALSQPIHRYWQQAGSFTAAALMLFIVGPDLSNNRVVDTPNFLQVSHQAESLELPIAYPPRREIQLAGNHTSEINVQRDSKPQLLHHRTFQATTVVVRSRPRKIIQLGPAPLLADSLEPSTPILVPAIASMIGNPPPYRSRNPWARLANILIAPIRTFVGNNLHRSP